MKVNLTKCLLIIFISSLLGILYNFVNPKGINFIAKQKEVKWASDSLFSPTYKIKDTVDKDIYANQLSEGKSIPSKKVLTDRLNRESELKTKKPPSVKKEYSIDKEEGFAEPIAINLEQAYMLYQRGIIFIDARDDSEFKSGHIKNSVNLPVYKFDNFKNVLSRISKSQTIVCYCGGIDCDLSKQLANKLFSLGYRNNYIFIGGWEQWKSAGYPVE